jgi:GTP-binding protein YchF
MSLQIGLVGLPNAGKSTLFNALTSGSVATASYPFTTIDPNLGVTAIPDDRLQAVARIVEPEKVIPATIEFVDIAGLVKGAHRGEGLGNQFLGHIRNTDAVAVVLRAFQDADVAHSHPQVDPLLDLDTLDLELALADIATIDRRVEKVQGQAKAQPKAYQHELKLLEEIRAALDGGNRVSTAGYPESDAAIIGSLNLLTLKPRLYLVNVGEEDLPHGGPLAQGVTARAAVEGAEVVVVCAQVEADLTEWDQDDAAAYRAELGLAEPGLNRLVLASYRLLDLVTFITATGKSAVRAWELERGSSAFDAAGKVHTDMQRGFIRAEVVQVQDLVAAGSFASARDRGVLRLEGKEYIVQDGDVIHFRFNV